uniref:ATP-dependent Clp protease proteolytic subunit n=1 Tax=Crescentia cujete TaxID=1125401 RepID=A0A1B1W6Y9_9LAMI|nr:ATP-dependent Clp protease proteolytic subunit [Crescentia cujete]
MPVGVPKVAFRIPGDEEPTWVDLNRLYQIRALFLVQDVNGEIGNQLAGLLIYFSIEDERMEFFLFIHCPGGEVIPGITLYDAMQWVEPDVHTICVGTAASMGSLLLVGGAFTKRLAFPHARVMIHQPASIFRRKRRKKTQNPNTTQNKPKTKKPTVKQLLLDGAELMRVRKRITNIYVQRTRKPFWVICQDLERDVFMSATEAQIYGIIDLIATE